jgi:hypothetical protein
VQGQSRTKDVANAWPGAGWLFNVNAFAPPGAYSVGNAARTYGDIRGFPYRNEDFALAKQFSISEHKHLEIRCDVLNAFNRSIWNNPNTSVTDPSRIQGGRASVLAHSGDARMSNGNCSFKLGSRSDDCRVR